ncbi:MAG: hypothetical protein HY903_02475 [Deltaproteobacteria bacterium]|nr:hypothetical protein [Deltaproteobacteria bacterium]
MSAPITRIAPLVLGLALTACTRDQDPPVIDTAKLVAGRDKIILAYDANLWGELIECG